MTHPSPSRRRWTGGFTLIELMVVVMIVLLLSAIAIPAFMKYLSHAKTTEARVQLEKLRMGARAYYLDGFAGRNLQVIERQFPASVAATPAISCCANAGRKCIPGDPGWTDPSWVMLGFSMDDPHLYRYEFLSAGTSNAATFTARARGDLDCDGVESTFETYGRIGTGGDPESSAGIARFRETE